MFVCCAGPRAVAVVCLVVLVAGAPTAAQAPSQDPAATSPDSLRVAIALAGEQLSSSQLPPTVEPAKKADARCPPVLMALYASYIGMQALEVHSTLSGLNEGAREVNPVLKGIAGNAAALVGVKAATTAGLIYGSEKLRKKNRVAAVLLMAALDSVTGYVVAHNYRQMR